MSGSINDNDCEDITNDSITVKLKSTSDSKEHEVVLRNSSTVQQLKDLTVQKMGVTINKNVRLIYQGKLLQPGEALLSSFNVKHGGFVHVAVSEKKAPSSGSPTGGFLDTSSNLHAGVLPSRVLLRGLDVLLSRERDDTFPNALFRPG